MRETDMGTETQIAPRNDLLRRWLPYCRVIATQPRVRLLCFSHAGGTALAFYKWPDKFPWNVQVCAVQYPGRERHGGPFIKRIPDLMNEMADALLPWLQGPVALLGHSLGAKIAFEFARRFRARRSTGEIVHLFVSGCPAPHLRSSSDPIYMLPDARFMERLANFGGTPREVLSSPEMMQYLMPRLRADFELDDTYTLEPEEPLACPITAWAGDLDDLVSPGKVEAWRDHTRGGFKSRILKGGHFAFYEKEAEVLSQVRMELTRTYRQGTDGAAIACKALCPNETL